MSTILTLNAGSSSLKFAVFEAMELICDGQVNGIGASPSLSVSGGTAPHPLEVDSHATALAAILRALGERGFGSGSIHAVGHRIVHGGAVYLQPLLVQPGNLAALDGLRALAPLHNSVGLDAIRLLMEAMPGVPQVACFDTAFHATQPDIATRLPLPAKFHDAGYRRYGFHGLSYEHVASELSRISGNSFPKRVIAFHLGNGSSICAMLEGRSIATTMGYSTLDGLIMGTRAGSIDPGVLIALMRNQKMGADELEHLLYRSAGLLGLSGITSDMQTLLSSDDAACARAVDHFCYSAAQHAASMLAALGGLDTLVFTGGIGARSPEVRRRIIARLAWLGIIVDDQRNLGNCPQISADDSRISVWALPANEELVIARHTIATVTGEKQ